MAFVTSLNLTCFRSYESARLEGLARGPVVLTGFNGAGKTNILEAVSLLSPGRGLRGARVAEMQKQEQPGPWSVAAEIETAYGPQKIGTGQGASPEKRIVRINGETARAQAALAEYLACVWLTPQMDRLFLEGASARRRFLDRLVFAFDPGHAGRVTRYENAMAQRAKILKTHAQPSAAWLEGLETTMVEAGVAIAHARLEFVGRLQQAAAQNDDSEEHLFPRAQLRAHGTLETLLAQVPAREVEEMFAYQLQSSRGVDAQNGGAATGAHKSDLQAVYAAKGMPADQCSTGEQKALLIGIILAHTRLVRAERGSMPILLLDEVAAHLDEQRRAALFAILRALGGQVWMTGTDRVLFRELEGAGQFFNVENGRVGPAARAVAA